MGKRDTRSRQFRTFLCFLRDLSYFTCLRNSKILYRLLLLAIEKGSTLLYARVRARSLHPSRLLRTASPSVLLALPRTLRNKYSRPPKRSLL